MAAYAAGSVVSQLWNDCWHCSGGWNWADLCRAVSAVRSAGCAGRRCSPRPHRHRRLILSRGLVRERGISPIRRLVNDFASYHCDQDFGLVYFRGLDLEEVAVEQDEVGQLARFE